MRPDAHQDLGDVHRLGDVVDGARIKALDLAVGPLSALMKMTGMERVTSAGLQPAAGLKPVNPRHHYIQQDQIGPHPPDAQQRFAAALGDNHTDSRAPREL